MARISLPIDINNDAPASYTADLIGGQGSLCPALLPNTSLRQMRSAVFTEWFDNGDGMMACSPNGLRLDHPDANLVIMRIVLTESGHYIIPINQQSEYDISDDDEINIKKMLQGNSKPYQTTTLEQTGNNIDDTENLLNGDKNQIPCDSQDKLQFATDEAAGNLIHDGLRMDPVSTGLSDGLRGDLKQVATDEKPIQVLFGKDYNIDYDESTTEYAGDIFPGHRRWQTSLLAEDVQGHPRRILLQAEGGPCHSMQRPFMGQEAEGQEVPLLGMVLRLWTPQPTCTSFWTLCAFPNRLSIWLGSWIA